MGNIPRAVGSIYNNEACPENGRENDGESTDHALCLSKMNEFRGLLSPGRTYDDRLSGPNQRPDDASATDEALWSDCRNLGPYPQTKTAREFENAAKSLIEVESELEVEFELDRRYLSLWSWLANERG